MMPERLSAIAVGLCVLGGTMLIGLSACDSRDDGRGSTVRVTNAALAFAPLLHLQEDEVLWPIDAEEFVGFSTLSWASELCGDEKLMNGQLRRDAGMGKDLPLMNPSRLGNTLAYRHQPLRGQCQERSATSYATTQYTRPFDGRRRAAGLANDEGFFLDVVTAKRVGNPRFDRHAAQAYLRNMPAYFIQRGEQVDGEAGLRITYWFLWGYERSVPESTSGPLDHEGDWEPLSVLLLREGRNRYAPVSVRYQLREGSLEVSWADVETVAGVSSKHRTHPVAYSARSTHTLYPSAGKRTVRLEAQGDPLTVREEAVACLTCPQWRTWKDLQPARAQPWYGYGGGWGNMTDDADTGGPLGPSPFS